MQRRQNRKTAAAYAFLFLIIRRNGICQLQIKLGQSHPDIRRYPEIRKTKGQKTQQIHADEAELDIEQPAAAALHELFTLYKKLLRAHVGMIDHQQKYLRIIKLDPNTCNEEKDCSGNQKQYGKSIRHHNA